MQRVAVGQTIEVFARFANLAGVAADPSTVTLSVEAPDDTVTTPAATNDPAETGRFFHNLTVTQAGVYTLTWVGTGTVSKVIVDRVVVGDVRRTGVCEPWISPEVLFTCGPCDGIAAADRNWALADSAVQAASDMLFLLSGHRFTGLCYDTVRPCRRCATWGHPDGWTWQRSWGMCGCNAPNARACGCGGLDEITLGGSPIVAVDEIRVDGAALASSVYAVHDGRWLVRLDGGSWPSCQDLTADPASETDTFEVSFVYGIEPPEAGILAARALACEIYQGCSGGDCALPDNVMRALDRQGVRVEFSDPSLALDNGTMGIPAVDRFLQGEQARRDRAPAIVASPDVGRRVRREGP